MAIIIDKSLPVELADTLGSIVSSVVEAQASAARSTVQFINDVGLQPGAPGQPANFRTVSFNYEKLDENQQRSQFTAQLPLLGLVDIPALSIKTASVSLDYQITRNTKLNAAQRTQLYGRIINSKGSGDSSEVGSIRMRMEMERAPLPPALQRALDILEVATHETKVVAAAPAPPPLAVKRGVKR